MRVVIDGLPIRGGSIAVVLRHLLDAWTRSDGDDELHIVLGTDAGIAVPPGVVVHEIDLGTRRAIGRMRAQATVLPRLCRELDADVMLAAIPATTLNRLPCPRVVIAHDIRHELRPEQFSTAPRLIRRVSHGIGFRQADAIISVSHRTRADLIASRPWLADRIVRVAQNGGDHVDAWPARAPGPAYAITFGQWGNKNVGLVLDAWQLLMGSDAMLPLIVVGLAESARQRLQARVDAAGLGTAVALQPWLDEDAFHARFASASMVVFASDFEGFGLPAVEAMRLGIPLAITPDPALLEVTGGNAAVTEDFSPEALAAAVRRARAFSSEQLAAAGTHAAAFTWSRMAEQVRAALLEAIDSPGRGQRRATMR
jgi:glycosyltransferase involved in cell wall biosynthesis